MNLYDQLLQLQEIPNAYENWKDYRNELTDYVMSQLGEGEHVAILGSGRSQDLDLSRLVKHMGQLTLIDKDCKGMMAAVKQYGLSNANQLEFVTQDLIGLTSEDYRLYADHLVTFIRRKGMLTSVEELAEEALKEIEKLAYKIKLADLGWRAFDTVIVIGLHSQLLSMMEWIWQVILQTLGKEEYHVRNYIIRLNEELIPALNEKIIESATKRVIIGCEQGRKGMPGTVQGAVQALQDLKIRRAQGQIRNVDAIELEWPFDSKSGKIYKMLIQSDCKI